MDKRISNIENKLFFFKNFKRLSGKDEGKAENRLK